MIYKFWEINDEKRKKLKNMTGIGIDYYDDEVTIEGYYEDKTIFSSSLGIRPDDEKYYKTKDINGKPMNVIKEDFIDTFISEVESMQHDAFDKNPDQEFREFVIAADNENAEDGNRVVMNMKPGCVTIKGIINNQEKILETFNTKNELWDLQMALEDALERAVEVDEE